ncbi:SDR family oxidoreductase [Pseudonocardia sp. KRD-291]|nr:SDR family oxidoreductase [Pseudonocardia sp. KRD291]
MASAAAAVGMAGRAGCGAAKAGVSSRTRVLAVEWAAEGIRVNAVAPGYVRTAGSDERIGVKAWS